MEQPAQAVEETKPNVEIPKSEETPKEETKTQDPQSKLAPKFAALAKREKQIYRQRLQTQEYEAKVKAREEAIAQKEAELALAQQDPIKALEKLGWNYDQITNYLLNNKSIPPEKQVADVRSELQALKRQQEEKERLALEQEQQRIQQEQQEIVTSFINQVHNFVDTNKDKYELIKLTGQEDVVYALIEENFNRTGKIMNMEEAADMVEKYQEELWESGLKTKKLSGKYQAPQPTADKVNGKSSSTTLTNDMNISSGPSMLPAATENDRIQRALAALSKV